ncbi:hypothetical protein DYB25_010552 [Aphanomyces astaci]|uniref:Uncharacterized protein n=1 Tax=Aphanomyces astaci TaxID=112090 RepID=A0A397D669_APHAT|nr:hypothetical protein DYB25_010552 [Aphanomyces astaci]RHY59509.1 hypothetical protein DYB38_004740 [Aphanomyces astaci]RHY81668.1 hypothetical protein DYB26_010325 [Aphanomyces astaci]RHY99593.1 hypothetical protein DYB31_007454 [Aphanomyces astaci]
MASWFGHTQTVASISKSVTTVAGGIICLESNLSNFMKKVIYYEGFFQRRSGNLPEDVNYAARKLLRRCHEYREAIREELHVAYVADAGRWVIGMEDWNTKMEKRMHQISELVLLANRSSLLVEFAVTGEPISNESLNDLSAYVNVITSTITLQDDALFHDSLKAAARHKIVPTDSSRTSSSSPASIPPPVLTSSPAPSMVVPPSPANRYDSDMADMDDDDDVPAPEDEDRLNPFNVMLDTCKQPRTEPMAIPMNDTRSSDGSSSGGRSLSQSSSSFPSDYCHLEREYGDELSEMTSFSSTAPRKEWQPPPPSKKKHAAAGKRPHHPYENAVYDLTVSYDFQKERMSNPFVAKAVTVERKSSLDEHTVTIVEEELGQDDGTDEDDNVDILRSRESVPSFLQTRGDQGRVHER